MKNAYKCVYRLWDGMDEDYTYYTKIVVAKKLSFPLFNHLAKVQFVEASMYEEDTPIAEGVYDKKEYDEQSLIAGGIL